MSESQLSPGTVVDGAYTLDAVVRSRPGATTYRASDDQGKAVWVTIYDRTCFPSGLALERSLRELRQLKNVVSARVLRVLNAGKHGDGVFEVTDIGPDQTLTEHLQAGALSLQDAATLAVQVGEALLEAQRAGVIHRNLGADVVFPSAEGVRVGGFAVGEPNVRGAGPLMTIAPEQVQGKVVDQRTLIYNVAALMHWMVSGTPLFSGTPEEVLSQHEDAAPSEAIDAKLRRALGKDPRMRPMMLKQFLSDIAQMGGVEPPKLAARVSAPHVAATPKAPIAAPKAQDAAVSRPSSRGWTMFMQAQDEEPEKPAEPEPPPSKPSTRGWTMFMKAQDDEGGEAAPEAVAQPALAAEPAPAPAAEPAPPTAAEGEAPPSTRGWTMFMKPEDGEAPSDAGAEQPAPAGQDAEPEPEPEPEPVDEAAPSTRGWTMFTKDDEAPEEEPAAEEAPAEAAAPAADDVSPSTRGWTMFTKDEDEPGSGPTPGAEPAPESTPAAEPAPDAAAAEAPEAGAAPSSRGWTMFMEPGASDAPAAAAPDAAAPEPAAPEPAAPETAAPEAAAEPGEEASGEDTAEPGASKKRGWTMFMNAPLEDLPSKEEAPSEPAPAPVSNVEAADKKGWTVFGAPALKRPEAAEAGTAAAESGPEPAAEAGVPSRGQTINVTNPAPVAAADARPEDVPDAARANAPTLVNTGAPAGTPVERGKTIVATSSPVEKPNTMYFKKGEVEPEGSVSPRGPTVRDVVSTSRPVEERVSRTSDPSAPMPVVREPTELEPAKSSNTALYVVAGSVAVAAAIGAYFAFLA